MEKLTAPIDGRDTKHEILSSLHGHHGIASLVASLNRELILPLAGPVGTSLPGLRLHTDEKVLNASAQLSTEYPYNHDVNSGDTIGISMSFYPSTESSLLPLITVPCIYHRLDPNDGMPSSYVCSIREKIDHPTR